MRDKNSERKLGMPPPYAQGRRETRDNIFSPPLSRLARADSERILFCRPETTARARDQPFLSLIDTDFVDKKLAPPIYSLAGLCGHRNVR